MKLMTTQRRHLFTLVAIATLLAVALGPGGAFAAPSKAERLSAELEDIRDDLRSAGREYDSAYWELDEAEVRMSQVQSEIELTEEELTHARGLLSDRVDLMYRSNPANYLALLFGSVTFEDMVTRLEFFRRIGKADADAIASVERLQAELRTQEESLQSETAAQADALAGLKARRDDLQRRFDDKQAEYDRVKAELDRERAASNSRSSVRAAPGANGMVFPVQGVHYFSDTWGASRSGGRRSHKGTDIMAGHGTPCVAVLSGTVTSKSGGLGGKVIWLTADNGWQFYYAHLDSWAVRSGRVGAGQVIGYVGSSGNASASSPHLHFQMHPGGGSAVNPYPYLKAMQ